MQKLVIVKPGCQEFANELLNHMSITACGLETGSEVINHSGFGYRGVPKILHAVYARAVGKLHPGDVVHAWRAPVYLPPTKVLPTNLQTPDSLYLYGWLYRNPAGLSKYRKELTTMFQPSLANQSEIASIISAQQNRTLVGIHLRQTSFKGFAKGEFLVPPLRVRVILDEYIAKNNLDPKQVALVIVSDAKVPPEVFEDFPTHVTSGNTEKNLFLLSKCATVIGTNTTFSNMSAWFGNVPHIVTTNEPIDWNYYKGKTNYFENKYATFTFI